MAEQLISTSVHEKLPESYVRNEAERPRLDEVVADADIPVVDLAHPDRATVVSQIGAACRSHGFFQVLNHGLPVELMLAAMAVANDFFRLSPEEKAKLYSDDPAKKMRLKLASVEKGSKEPQREKVGKVTVEQVRVIAQEKLPDLNCKTIESAMRIIAGTAANMGIDVDPPILVKKEKVVF